MPPPGIAELVIVNGWTFCKAHGNEFCPLCSYEFRPTNMERVSEYVENWDEEAAEDAMWKVEVSNAQVVYGLGEQSVSLATLLASNDRSGTEVMASTCTVTAFLQESRVATRIFSSAGNTAERAAPSASISHLNCSR
jgi:hypothetical protein